MVISSSFNISITYLLLSYNCLVISLIPLYVSSHEFASTLFKFSFIIGYFPCSFLYLLLSIYSPLNRFLLVSFFSALKNSSLYYILEIVPSYWHCFHYNHSSLRFLLYYNLRKKATFVVFFFSCILLGLTS